jgi:hypothetical protein
MPVGIVHRLAMEFSPLRDRMLSPPRHRSVIAMTVIEVMIDMAIEMIGAMEPRSSSNEHTARKPFRTVISVRRAVVRRNFVVAVRAYRRRTDLNCNLCVCRSLIRGGKKQAGRKRSQTKTFQHSHSITSVHWRGYVPGWLLTDNILHRRKIPHPA